MSGSLNDFTCQCPLAGFCERHQIKKGTREHQICNGVGISAGHRAKYLTKWETDAGLTEFMPPPGEECEEEEPRPRRFARPEVAGTIVRSRSASRPSSNKDLFACTHRSKEPVRIGACDLCCSGKGQPFEVFGCSLHGECSVNRKHSKVRSCVSCPDIESPAQSLIGVPIDREKLVTHILYHVMPLAGKAEPIWRRHVAWLREVRPEFNGRLIVGIVTKAKKDEWDFVPPEEVMRAFDGMNAEFVVTTNKKKMGEGVTFPKMLDMIRSHDPNEVFFYGHTKGVTHPDHALDLPPHLWAEAMFETLFCNRNEVVKSLDKFGITGSFRTPAGVGHGSSWKGPPWFYSGTFFAGRSADVFSRNWIKLRRHYGCVEQWPHSMFERDTESGCVFFDEVTNLYDKPYWHSHIMPALEDWRLPERIVTPDSAKISSRFQAYSAVCHGGDYGDLVYHLPVIKKTGIRKLILSPLHGTRERMSEEHAAGISALIREGCDYIDSVEWMDACPKDALRLDDWRRLLPLVSENTNLQESARAHLGVFRIDVNEPWLIVDPLPAAKVVLARSHRYRNESFPWKHIVDECRKDCVFVGTHEEYADFSSRFGSVPYQVCRTLLDVARIIAGGKLFIGNQSCPRAIAEGLKVPVIVEDGNPKNTRFVRPGAWYSPGEQEAISVVRNLLCQRK